MFNKLDTQIIFSSEYLSYLEKIKQETTFILVVVTSPLSDFALFLITIFGQSSQVYRINEAKKSKFLG